MSEQDVISIPYTELPAAQAGSPITHEWDVYRREVARLLEQGLEGKFILIKGDAIVGIWNTQDEAEEVARQRYLLQPVLIHQVRRREPVVRTPLWL